MSSEPLDNTQSLPGNALPEINDNIAPATTDNSKPSVFSLDEMTDNSSSPTQGDSRTKVTIDNPAKDTIRSKPSDSPTLKDKEDEPAKDDDELEEDNEKDDKGGKKESKEPDEEAEDGELDKADDKGVIANEEDKQLHGNNKRDFAGFNSKQIKILKRLDPQRFKLVSEEWRALQTAAGKAVTLAQQLEEQKVIASGKMIPSSWYEHPEAYQLSPEFREISGQYAQLETVENFYQQQLSNVHDGKEFRFIQSYDQQGNPVYSAPQPATPQAVGWLTQQLTRATSQKGQLEGRVNSLQQNFQVTHKQAADGVRKEMETYLGRLSSEIKPEEKDMQMIEAVMPKIYKDHPLAYGYKVLGAITFAQGRYLQRLLGEKSQSEKLDADKKLAGTRGSNKLPKADPSSSSSKSSKDVFKLQDLINDN
jgi:hypothetical protein